MSTAQAEREQFYKNKLDKARNGAYYKSYKSLSTALKGPRAKVPLEAIKLGLQLRKAIDNHEKAPWVIALAVAISCDCTDLVPIAGWIIALFFKPLLFIILWGKGSWRIKILLLLLDFIPIISMIPLSTACVVYAYYRTKKKARKAKEKLKKISKK